MNHTVIRSKMKKAKPLMDDPILSRHVPDTDWFHVPALQRMLQTYPTVYIKPDKGRQGNGIIRVRKLNDSEYEISHRETTKKLSSNSVFLEIDNRLRPQKTYLIQQGIDLATYNHRPFDLRLVLQKPLNRWLLSMMSAKIAPRKDSVVTNVAKGAKEIHLFKALQGMDQSLIVSQVLSELIDISHQIVQVLSSHVPLETVGLDMAIDKKGKVWYIEANTKPDHKGLEKLDRKLYRRYLEANKWIGKG